MCLSPTPTPQETALSDDKPQIRCTLRIGRINRFSFAKSLSTRLQQAGGGSSPGRRANLSVMEMDVCGLSSAGFEARVLAELMHGKRRRRSPPGPRQGCDLFSTADSQSHVWVAPWLTCPGQLQARITLTVPNKATGPLILPSTEDEMPSRSCLARRPDIRSCKRYRICGE